MTSWRGCAGRGRARRGASAKGGTSTPLAVSCAARRCLPARKGRDNRNPNRRQGYNVAATGETSAQLALRDPDIRIMIRVRNDEAGAFEELVEGYQHRLVGVMNHL